jgi:hypothetical protein
MLKRFFKVNFFFSNVLVPGVALVLYCGFFAYLSSHFLLEGVNYFFVSRLGKYALFVMVGVVLTFFVILWTKKGSELSFKYSNEKFYSGDFLFLLLPLTPVVQYVLNNQEILSPLETLYVLIFFLFFSGIYIFAIPALLRIIIPTRTLMILGLAFVFTIVSMSSMSDYFNWFEEGALRKQLVVFGGVFLVVWLLYNLNQRRVLYLFIAVNFMVNSSVQLLSQSVGEDAPPLPAEENRLLSLVWERTPVITPNIYLLVYDAYVPNETMLTYGIDNSAQEDYLSEQGFKLYPHTYSIEATTIETMSKVLNASTEHYGDMRRGVSGDGITQILLRDIGYETYGLFPSDHMFRGFGESYDYSIPESSIPPYVQLLKAIFLGEFRFDIQDVGFSEQPRQQFVETKQRIFEDVSGNRVFIYMHSDLPAHSQKSGACRPDETDRFEKRLTSANSEMRKDVNLIIENDPGAIVIVAGDHGPYLTKNCYVTTGVYDISEISRLDIQDRHATFLAVRWPTGDFVKYDDITVLQDLFPAVFAYLYKDATILESKIEPIIPVPDRNRISDASVNNGVINGGIDDGEPLFLSDK